MEVGRKAINTQLNNIMKRTRNRYHMEFKKCKRTEQTIKNSKLLDPCLNGNGNFFKEIKLIRKAKYKCANTIDGVTNDIPNHFKNIYSELYSSVTDGDEVEKISKELETKIEVQSVEDVNK